jgi:tRNA (adenine37-N6)-methyltransferase
MDSTVLLVMDVQAGIVARFGDPAGYLERLAAAIGAARQAGVPVIYVTVGFRDGYPEVSGRNKTFAAIAGSGGMTSSDPAAVVHPAVAPRPGDPVVTKRRVSAFAGSDLDVLLRGLEAGRLVLAGIATSGVVLSTLRQAADLDYAVTVLSDACLDRDQDVHEVLTRKVFPRQAEVMTVEQWSAELLARLPHEPVTVTPVGWVHSSRSEITDDHWGSIDAVIRLDRGYGAEAVAGLAEFSHLEVVYQFHLVPPDQVESGARHPRGNQDWPRVGIFAQRGKNRPNRLGVSRCALTGVDGTDLHVRGLDAVDGTPVLDIKPYLREFGPRGEVRQPAWSTELMSEYYT